MEDRRRHAQARAFGEQRCANKNARLSDGQRFVVSWSVVNGPKVSGQ
jgi:hypothetical protein